MGSGSDSDNPMTEEGIRLCGHHMKEEELNEIFLALDADGTGGASGDGRGCLLRRRRRWGWAYNYGTTIGGMDTLW